VLATASLLLGPAGQATATGPGGWDHVGDAGGAATPSLNGAVYTLNADRPNTLYVGGNFTDAGGVSSADRIASWNGSAWSAVSSPSSQISNGAVNAIAYDAATGHVFAGGTFTNAGGDANADFLAVWDGTSWAPFCNGTSPPITATVNALQIIGRTLYVAGAFADGAGIASADRLVACNLDTGASSSTVIDAAHEFSGTIYALAADSNGTLYAGGGFTDLGGEAAADNVAYLDGSGVGWHAMGSGAGACSCAVNDFVRSLTAVGTDVYVGTDAQDVAGIAQADHVARWNGSAWSAVGANTAGTGGWFPASSFIYGLANDGTHVYATGSFQNANGDPTADFIASFNGGAWHPVGSDGAGNGPWSGNGLAVAVLDRPGDGLPLQLYAGGNFTSAGGDNQARYLASYALAHTLTVTVVGTGTGTVQAPQINCPPTCVGTYPTGTKVSLSAAAPSGSHFLGFTGGCAGAGGCDVTLDSDKAVTATFSLPPVCADQSITATGTVAMPVHLQCSNPGGGSLFYYIPIVSGPHHGTLGQLDVNGLPHGDGVVTYTPTPGYVGPDGFTYGALLDAGSILPAFSNEATLTIDVVDATKPQISKLALSTTTFRAASSGASISAVKIGATVSFSLSEASSVRFSASRTGKGPKPKGSFKFAGKKGTNSFTFRGRIGGRRLAPGRYQLIARATDRSKNASLPRRVAFKIVR
jgi:hypothetical protein